MKAAALSLWALVVLGLAQPAAADGRLIDFLGGQGCVIGPESRAAALDAGFATTEIDALAEAVAKYTDQTPDSTYVMLNRWQCKLRLPDGITSPYTVNSPEILAITSAIDAHADDGWPGCFLQDPALVFDALNGGGKGSGFKEYFNFVASSIIAGDLRYYSPSPIAAPPGFQVVTGACADVPDIESIRQSHSYVSKGFGQYIRQFGEATPCESEPLLNLESALAAYVQGVDPSVSDASQPRYNAGIWLEYMMIALAAGWRDGMSASGLGSPRPPLCFNP